MVKNVCQKEKNISHPLFGISFKKWLDLLIYNRGFEPEYFTRVFFITLTSISLIPLRFLFKIFYGPLIEKTMVKHPPIFIIGHWRSGTTFLHELISQDPQIGYVSLWQTLLPESFLILEKSKDFLSKFLPRTRPMDNIEVDINGPYEEEAGLAVLSKWSFFHCFHFPRFAKRQYFKSVHFKDLNENEIKQWKKTYTQLIKAATFTNHGKLLVLKNPSNTARIKILLEMFPDAKFIHIYRNPFYVYVSTIKMRTRVLEKLALQNTTNEEIKKHVIEDYIHLMKTFFKQKKLICLNCRVNLQ